MSAVNLLSSLKEKSTDDIQTNGSCQPGLEESGGSGGGGDPAVLAVGPVRRPLTYTRDELMRLRNSPLVKRNLESAFIGCETLALVLKRRSDSPNEEDKGAKGDAPSENHKGVYGRRSADPRERVRKESEPSGGGIVLSPQRRSFTSGCGAPATAQPPPPLARTRPDSPLSTPHAQPQQHEPPRAPPQPKTEQAGRRIGSGRIMVRDVPSGNWEEGEFRNEQYRRTGDRFDRRSFGRDSYSSDIKRERDDRFNNEKTRDREDNRRSGGRFSQRRFEKEDEPEWFSGGPTSQLETIELRGFDEPTKKNGTTSNKDSEKWSGSGSPPERWRADPDPAPADLNLTNDKDSGVESKGEDVQQNNDQPDFNLDEFLCDSIPDVLTNGGGEAEGSRGSRFSQWFRRDSPTGDRHYERLLHNMVDELDNSSCVESPPEARFQGGGGAGSGAAGSGAAGSGAAGSGAAGSAGAGGGARAAPSLLELLRRAGTDAEQRAEMNSSGGKIHSLEELEARLRPHPHPHHHDHDLSAFKRLLAQVSGGHAVTAEPPRAPPPQPQPQPQPQPLSLLQMLNKSMEQQQQQQQHQQQQQQQQQQKAQQQQPPHIPQELLYKLLQVQQRQQAGELGGSGGTGGGGGAALGPADRDLLQRPEAQAIIHGLKAGEITAAHLMQQLGNPGLQSRHRDLLLTILRLHQTQRQQQMGGSPLPSGVGAAPHLVVPPHHQPLRLSPLPHPAFCVSPIMATSPNALSVHHPGVPARIPSPRELAAHTQSIMQSALIKKKLEEQRENFRRRHDATHLAHAPHAPHAQHAPHKQPTPISFTPTSVLRKMTAEKESEAPSPKQQQWSQPIKMPQGRPIVKGNQSGAAPMGYPPSQAEYQQHYLNQQQQMSNANRPFTLPQQRQQVPNSYNNMNNMRGMPSGNALHQFLVQTHQRTLNELGGGGGVGGGDNQLARWFSPELLARASAGKLPSVHVPNALQLEDLERHHHSPAPPVRN